MFFSLNIWPILDGQKERKAIYNTISSKKIQNKIETVFTQNGLRNYLIQIYSHQKWTGSYWNHFRPIEECLRKRYKDGSTLLTYTFEEKNLDEVLKLKEYIRDFCGMGKNSIHISDNEEESKQIIDIVSSDATVRFMNYCLPDQDIRFARILDGIKKQAIKCKIAPEEFLIVSDCVYNLYNRAKIRKISWIPIGKESVELNKKNSREYAELYEKWDHEIKKKENQITYFGFRFVVPELIDKMRKEIL